MFASSVNLEEIAQHPYIIEHGTHKNLAKLTRGYGFERMTSKMYGLIEDHETEPYDAIIGDDVSGRIPALIAHRLFRLASENGKMTAHPPKTLFLASGMVEHHDRGETADNLQDNICEQALKITETFNIARVGIITELIASGRSVERIQWAFETIGVESTATEFDRLGLYLNEYGNDHVKIRPATGIEKQHPEPISQKHPEFNARAVSQLRCFLDDYTAVLYNGVFDESLTATRAS